MRPRSTPNDHKCSVRDSNLGEVVAHEIPTSNLDGVKSERMLSVPSKVTRNVCLSHDKKTHSNGISIITGMSSFRRNDAIKLNKISGLPLTTTSATASAWPIELRAEQT